MEQNIEPDQRLRGKRILIADDEFLIAITIEETLRDAGAETIEPLSAALLDVQLGHETTDAVADILAARAIPFVFYTGQAIPDRLREKHPNTRVLNKPAKLKAIVDMMLSVAGL
jgi:hypothetical protein